MLPNDRIRLQHMLDAALDAQGFIENKCQNDLVGDRQLALAILKCIEIVGEAATQISPVTQEQLTSIPWRQLVGMRNRLVHAYFDINLNIVWKTVTEDLSPLIDQLRSALST